LHRDLKPQILLLDENKNLKVSDFGSSALAESKRQDELLHTTCGTPVYVAAEVTTQEAMMELKLIFGLPAVYLKFRDPDVMESLGRQGREN
jgi:5'-AMP-activated protein kinase catalytic alpha subunit